MYYRQIVPIKDRIGNKLPPTTNQNTRVTPDRESMLYSYQNSVESSYAGDIRHYVSKFGTYLETKNKIFDLKQNAYIDFPIRYAAPNLAFSTDKGITGAEKEASIKDRIILPVISYYMTGMERDDKRSIDPSVSYFYKPDKNDPSKCWITTAPRATNYMFQVDVWTETRESFYQILTAFQLDFNPYSYLTDIYSFEDETQKTFYIPYARMTLSSFNDQSNFVPGTDRRVVRGTLNITVEGFLTQPPKNVPYVFNTTFSLAVNKASLPAIQTIKSLTSSNTLVTESESEITGALSLLGTSLTSGVSSVFGRTGAVTSVTGDYTTDQITTDSIAGVAAPGDTLDVALTNLAEIATTNSFTIKLAQTMPSGSVFTIINNQAYQVTSLSSILPSIVGVTLEEGVAGANVTAGRNLNISYTVTTIPWITDAYVYLSQTGGITTTVPSPEAGDKYSIIIGRVLAGTTSLIFNPMSPMKLF
jgi:hypothetical protein